MKYKLNSSAFSLLEIMVATGMVAASLTATLALLQQNQKEKKRAQMITGVQDLHPPVIQSLNQLLFSTQNATTKKNDLALCSSSLIPDPTNLSTSSPLAEIKINLTSTNVANALNSRWTSLFGTNWEIVTTGCPLSGPWSRCLKLKYDQYPADLQTKLKAMSPLIKATITPLNFDPESLTILNPYPAGTTLVDAKKVLFKLNSEIEYSSSGGAGGSKTSDNQAKYIWAAEVGWCDRTISGRALRLFPTGTGEGDSSGTNIYNSPSFSSGMNPPLDIVPQKRQLQEGVIEGGQVRSDPTKNIEVSCNEIRFTCRNDSANSRTYSPDLVVDYSLLFNRNNSSGAQSSTLSPSLSVRLASDVADSETEDDLDLLKSRGATVNYQLDPTPPTTSIPMPNSYFEWPNKRFYSVKPPAGNTAQYPSTTNPIPRQMTVAGSHLLRMSVGNSQNVCSEICSSENFRNLPYRPRLKYTLWDVLEKTPPKSYSREYLAEAPVGCTACYMKSCSRLGIKTFGPMSDQPAEPLDASVPECAIKNDRDLSRAIPPDVSIPANTPASSCIAGHLDNTTSSGSIIFSQQPCTTQLPVLCFNYGKFFLARNVSASSNSLATTNHSDAARRCYETGKETVNRASLQSMFTQSSSPTTLINQLPPSSTPLSATATFFNNATQGIFLAPQNAEQIRSARANIQSDGLPISQYFWVGYKTDDGGNLMAVPPLATLEQNANYWYSLYFEQGGRVVLKSHSQWPQKIVTSPPSGVGGYALTHHLRYRGLLPTAQTQATADTPLEFLCWKNESPYFFATQGKASRSQSVGVEKCKEAGGVFIPPTTPLGWVKALLVVAPNSPYYPFPDPEDEITISLGSRYLITDAGTRTSSDWQSWGLNSPTTSIQGRVFVATKSGTLGGNGKVTPAPALWINLKTDNQLVDPVDIYTGPKTGGGSGSSQNFTKEILGAVSWTDTEVNVTEDEALTITATGEITTGQNGESVSMQPTGSDTTPPTKKFVETFPTAALIGKIGNGTPFLVGASFSTQNADASGRLFLAVNDDKDLSTTRYTGKFTVTITTEVSTTKANKVMCELSTGLFEEHALQKNASNLGCPTGSRRITFSGTPPTPGLLNQIIWLMGLGGNEPGTTKRYYVTPE